MASIPSKSRLRKLLIALAAMAVAAATFHIIEYRLTGDSPVSSWHRASGSGQPNYSKVEEGLWMGGFVDRPPRGTQAVLNLCGSKDPYVVERKQDDTIPDGPPVPSIEWLARQVAFIESERAAGHTVYVHCMAGISRSGMVMAAYYMRREGWSADQAIQFLRSKRPGVDPNPAFRPLLEEWERAVKNRATKRDRPVEESAKTP